MQSSKTYSSLEGSDARKILNRNKITPTYLYSQHAEDATGLAGEGNTRVGGARSQSSGLISKKLTLMQKRRLAGGGASTSQMLNYGGLGGEPRHSNESHQQQMSFDAVQKASKSSLPMMPSLGAFTNQTLGGVVALRQHTGKRESGQHTSPLAAASKGYALVVPNTAVGTMHQKAITPQLSASPLEKPETSATALPGGQAGSETMGSSKDRISALTAMPGTGQQQKGYHSIEPLGLGRNLLHDSGSEEKMALSSNSPNLFSVDLSHNDPHSASNLQLPRKEGHSLREKTNIKIYQSNSNIARKLAYRTREDETLRSHENQPNAYSTFGRENNLYPSQPQLRIKHVGSMPVLHNGQSNLVSSATTKRKETAPEEGEADA